MRTEHKCAKVGGDCHDGCTVVDDGSLKIAQMYIPPHTVLKYNRLCSNVLKYAYMSEYAKI